MLDLFAVSLSAAVELNEETAVKLKLATAVRLWNLVVFVFDVALVQHEVRELKEEWAEYAIAAHTHVMYRHMYMCMCMFTSHVPTVLATVHSAPKPPTTIAWLEHDAHAR